jgi:hypothetical protein
MDNMAKERSNKKLTEKQEMELMLQIIKQSAIMSMPLFTNTDTAKERVIPAGPGFMTKLPKNMTWEEVLG